MSPRSQVFVELTDDFQRVEDTAPGQLAPLVRDEAIETGGAPVFGLIDDAGDGIDGDRLVVEPPQITEK